MTSEQIARYLRKAGVVAAAWLQTLGEPPTRHALILAMAVADFETRLGDAGGTWRGEHNWGAVHKRSVTPDEAAILLGHGVYPSDDDALRTARGLLPAGPNEALHIDKNRVGPYFVWLWAFDNDTDGAAKYLEILVRNRPSVRAVIDTATPIELASAMYVSRYYEGTSRDPSENIRTYAARIEDYAFRVETALQGWPPPPLPSAPSAARPPLPGASAAEKRGAAGWWLAGIALVGVGAFFMGRRS
jgi:hypothetical protein